MNKIKTVSELKEFLKKYSDNTPIITISDDFEMCGSIVEGIQPKILNVERTFIDRMEVFEECAWGTEAILF